MREQVLGHCRVPTLSQAQLSSEVVRASSSLQNTPYHRFVTTACAPATRPSARTQHSGHFLFKELSLTTFADLTKLAGTLKFPQK